jgi:C-terminal processing protease CtpA/Prc
MDPAAKPSSAIPPRLLLAAALLAILLVSAAALLLRRPENADSTLQNNARQFIADPIQFATNRFKGGIGAALIMDSTNSLPRVNGIIPGSPAEAGGLRAKDLILEIDGTPTKGLTLIQTVEKIRGWTVAGVDLLVERDGTNLTLRISRASWDKLKNLGTFQ